MNIEDYEYFSYPEYTHPVTQIIAGYETELIVETRPGYHYSINKKTLVATGYETSDRPCRLRKKGADMPKDQFHVTGGGRTWSKDKWVKLDTYDTVAEAKEKCTEYTTKAHETESPFAFKITKETIMSAVHNYHEWAADRFASGEYTPTPWADIDAHPEHYARMSKEVDGAVAFWLNPAEAQRDEVTVLSAGSYLSRYYAGILRPEEIEAYVHLMNPPGELELSGTSPSDIFNAYQRALEEGGVSSCMAGDDDFEDESPVRVYGAGDLQVLLLIRRGRAVARALCWPEKMVVGRMYGDIGRMRNAVEAAGWTLDGRSGNDMHTRGYGGFNGARILKIDTGDDNFVAPYVDFQYKLKDCGTHFELNRDQGEHAHRTDGLLFDEYDRVDCDHCGARHSSRSSYNHEGETLCSTCYGNLQECSDCDDHFHPSDLTDGRCHSCEEVHDDVCA